MSERRVIVSRDADGWAPAAGEWVADSLRQAVASRGSASFALAGGSTPRRVYECLAAMPLREQIPWAQLSVYWGDERCVSPDDEQSNFRMAREALLDHVPVPDHQIHRMRGELADREAASDEYAALLPDRLDLLLLGIGEDGHTASLFPDAAALAERERRVVAVCGTKPPPWRLTITPPVIAAAREVAVLARGSAKADIVARAMDTRSISLPIQLASDATWILDPDAAALLRDGVPNRQDD